jgi:Ankyrin repeats (3 copies)
MQAVDGTMVTQRGYAKKAAMHAMKEALFGNDDPTASLEAIKEIVRADSSVLTFYQTNLHGRCPLHQACCNPQASKEIVEFLIASWPEGLRRRDDLRGLPIHIAVENRLPLEIIRILVERYPDGLRMQGHMGRTPLHMAVLFNGVMRERNKDVIKFLYDQYPNAIQCRDERGYLPIHLDLLYTRYPERPGYSHQITKYLVDAYPKGLQEKATSNQCLPIHLAVCHHQTSLETVQYLVRRFPECLQVKNSQGRVPLHCSSCEYYKASVDTLMFLVESTPEALVNPAHLLHHYLFLKGRFNMNSVTAVQYLVTKFPWLAQMHCNGEIALHAIARTVATEEPNLEALGCVVDAYPRGLFVKSVRGLTPLEEVKCAPLLPHESVTTFLEESTKNVLRTTVRPIIDRCRVPEEVLEHILSFTI